MTSDPIPTSTEQTETYPSRKAAWRYVAYFLFPIVLTAIGITAFLLVLRSRGELAAVPMTGSISFNEKLEFLRRRPMRTADVLAVGSSMVLNNLDTATITADLPRGMSYVNVGSWGLKMRQTHEFTDFLLPRLKPRAVILVCGPMDFGLNDQIQISIDAPEFSWFLDGEPYPLAVAKHLDLQYYCKQAKLHSARVGYDLLAFDAGGGVPLDVHYPDINPARWNHKPAQISLDPAEYDHLKQLADSLRNQRIAFFVLQPPFRRQATADAASVAVLQEHYRRLAEAMGPDRENWINLQPELDLPDSFFADYSHLNAKGAKRFTSAAMAHIGDRLAAGLAVGSASKSATTQN